MVVTTHAKTLESEHGVLSNQRKEVPCGLRAVHEDGGARRPEGTPWPGQGESWKLYPSPFLSGIFSRILSQGFSFLLSDAFQFPVLEGGKPF